MAKKAGKALDDQQLLFDVNPENPSGQILNKKEAEKREPAVTTAKKAKSQPLSTDTNAAACASDEALDMVFAERKKLGLLVLLKHKRFGPNQHMTSIAIADAVSELKRRKDSTKKNGSGTAPNQWRHVLSSLVKLGLVRSGRGRGGGYWLTAAGKKQAKTLQSL